MSYKEYIVYGMNRMVLITSYPNLNPITKLISFSVEFCDKLFYHFQSYESRIKFTAASMWPPNEL